MSVTDVCVLKNGLVLVFTTMDPLQVENLFNHLPSATAEESFRTLANGRGVKIERIISQGHSSPSSGWYDQELDEWVIVLSGQGHIKIDDGRQYKLKAGDYLTIPAHTKHKVTWTSPKEPTIWIAVHFMDR